MRYAPLANRVILREIEERKTTTGGLAIPDIARVNKGISFGEVLEVGPGRYNSEGKLVPVHVKQGDVVCFPRQAPAVLPMLKADGTEEMVLLCAENDIIAVVHDLPRETHLVGLDGALLRLAPQSLAKADSSYKNEDDINRAVSDLKASGAPADVIAELDDHEDEVIA